MNFTLNSEQQMLQDSVRRFIERDYRFDARRASLATRSAASDTHWRTFAQNGWLAAALPGQHGGLDGTVIDTALIAQEFGRGLVIEPYLGCAVLAAQTIAAAGTAAQCAALLPSLADGSRKLALAYGEAQSRGFAQPVGLRAQRSGHGYRLHGGKTLVLGGADADAFVVSASIPGEDGVTLLLVPAGSDGLIRRAAPLHDGSWAADLRFDGVAVPDSAVLGEPGRGLPALQHGLAHATAALCAELVGAMEKALELTADYLRVRQQFGVPIGSFQALQHRLADMAAALEMSRSMLFAMLASLTNDDMATHEYSVSLAKTLIGRAAKFVCGQAIQLHGGIGMTEEYQVGHYYKRAVVADVLFGSSDGHEARCARHLQSTLTHGDIQA